MQTTEPVKKSVEATDLVLRLIIIITVIGAVAVGYIASSLSGNMSDGFTTAAFVVLLGIFVLIFGKKYDK